MQFNAENAGGVMTESTSCAGACVVQCKKDENALGTHGPNKLQPI